MQQLPNDHIWECITCKTENPYYYNKCKSCLTKIEQFWSMMKIDYQAESPFKVIAIIDMSFNQKEDLKEILELNICHMEFAGTKHRVVKSRSHVLKPQLIPIIQNPEYCNIKQEQAEQGVDFRTVFDIQADAYIFENRQKAMDFKQQCDYLHLDCPIHKMIDLSQIFPIQTGYMNTITMMKALKIPYDKECFSLADVVDDLLESGYALKENMVQTMINPIPEEVQRLKSFDHLIIIDFEATCDDQEIKQKKAEWEIIEFPAVVYSLKEQRIVRQQDLFIKPVEKPILTQYCTTLTGITQEQVDNGILLQESINRYKEFIQGLGRCVAVTCGDYDFTQLKKECARKKIDLPIELKYYINLKKVFPKHLRDPQQKNDPPMVVMLDLCNLKLEGRHHSGIDDALNITRIADYLIKGGFQFQEPMISYTFKI